MHLISWPSAHQVHYTGQSSFTRPSQAYNVNLVGTWIFKCPGFLQQEINVDVFQKFKHMINAPNNT